MNSLHVKKNDTVVVLSGKDKGKRGKVLTTIPKKGKVIVEGINISTIHMNAQKSGGKDGGIVHRETPINAVKVMRVCPKCNEPTRPGHTFLDDGSKVSVCKKCNEAI